MTTHITPNKIDELIIYILKRLNRDVGSIELAKYLYLIDIESIQFTGKSLTGQTYNKAPQGPLAQDFKSSTNWMDGYEIDIEIRDSGKGNKESHLHKIGKNPRFQPNLDKIEKAIINRVLGRYYNKSVGQLKKIAYETKPWKAVKQIEKETGEGYRGPIDLSVEGKKKAVTEWENNISHIPEIGQKHRQLIEKEQNEFRKLISHES